MKKLEQALSRILGEEIEVSASGRTDAGTHAKMQVVSFHCRSEMPCDQLLAQLQRYLPEDIGVYSCRNASARFHARLNAKEKTYCYRVWNSDAPCVFERKYVYQDGRKLDVEKMSAAAQLFVGQHDFSAFCANKHFKKSTVRTIFSIEIRQDGPCIWFVINGNGFLHNMVRILVGTLVEVGLDQRTPESLQLLFGAERAAAGFCMAPQGLCLMEVEY